MITQELLNFIALEDTRLHERHESLLDREKRILARSVKLSEEVGELAAEVLSTLALQRKEKIAERDASKLQDELADVLITTLLLARVMGIDVTTALQHKITRINQRYSPPS